METSRGGVKKQATGTKKTGKVGGKGKRGCEELTRE
jgi:hypothetical protein